MSSFGQKPRPSARPQGAPQQQQNTMNMSTMNSMLAQAHRSQMIPPQQHIQPQPHQAVQQRQQAPTPGPEDEEGPEHQEEGPEEREATKRWYEWIMARNHLHFYANSLIQKIGDVRELGGKLSEAEKMGIKRAADEAIAWLDSNEDTSVEQLKDRLSDLEKLVKEATEEEYFSAEDMEGPEE